MKEKFRDVRDSYRSIEGRIKDPANKEGKFEDPRVYHLWALAQKAGLNEEELESMRVHNFEIICMIEFTKTKHLSLQKGSWECYSFDMYVLASKKWVGEL